MTDLEKKATEIVELFEDVLDRFNIFIPADDEQEERERARDGENIAKLYGMVYWNLVEDVVNALTEVGK